MAEIRIILQSDLCAGSGEGFGNVVDTDLCLDAYGLPVIPGRRIKGCLRQGAELLVQVGILTEEELDALFGTSSEAGQLEIGDAEIRNAGVIKSWLFGQTQEKISAVSGLYTSVRGQTAMKDGVADHGTLRYIRVLDHIDPLTGENLVLTVPVRVHGGDDRSELLKKCCQAVRHIGTHRNRGLGWVKLEYCPDSTETKNAAASVTPYSGGERKEIPFFVRLDSNMVLSMRDRRMTYVPGRSVLGCMARTWLRKNGARNSEFDRLFLTGEVRWSDLTPVIDGRNAKPAPLMLAWMKYGETYKNRLARHNGEEHPDKVRTLEGSWAVRKTDGWTVASVPGEFRYHHRHAKDESEAILYSHESVCSGLIYGGTVSVPTELAETVKELLEQAEFRFGHSKNAEYARCSLVPAGQTAVEERGMLSVNAGEYVYVILEADLLITENGRYAIDCRTVRQRLSEALGSCGTKIKDACPEDRTDYIRYSLTGGYHTMWHLYKPQIEVVAGGSVFCFEAETGGAIPSSFCLGEYLQEGMGSCRVMTGTEMEAAVITRNGGIARGTGEAADESVLKPFRTAVLCWQIEDNLSAGALALFGELKRNPNYRQIDSSRLRLMAEESDSPQDLKTRIETMKNEKRQKAGRFLLAKSFGDNLDTLPFLRMVDTQLQTELNAEAEEDRKHIFDMCWKSFIRILLQLIARDLPENDLSDDEEEWA